MDIETIEEMPLKEGQSVMAIMGREGDVKAIWDRNNPDEVESVRVQFEALKKKGFIAFRVTGKDGVKGERLHEFDPTAERIIFAPAPQGG